MPRQLDGPGPRSAAVGPRVVVTGAGIIGASTALALSDSGCSVTLVDQWPVGDPRIGSSDHARVFRYAYGPDRTSTELAQANHPLWRELERRSGKRLLAPAGELLLDRPGAAFARRSAEVLQACGLPAELVEGEALLRRFPSFAGFSAGCWCPPSAGSGYLRALDALRATLGIAIQAGVSLREGAGPVRLVREGDRIAAIALADDTRLDADRFVIAAGAWTPRLLPGLSEVVRPTRQPVVYFRPRSFADAADLPVFAGLDDSSAGFYGIPVHHDGCFKIGDHAVGPVFDPDSPEGRDSGSAAAEAAVASCSRFLREHVPALAGSQPAGARICVYDSTPNRDFIVGPVPGLDGAVVGCGFSGHGFKFAPVLGRILADLVLERDPGWPKALARWAPPPGTAGT